MSFKEKVLFYANKVKEFFIEQPPERYTNCLWCGKILTGSQRKFCSNKKCNNYYNRYEMSKIQFKQKMKGGKN